MQIGMIGLGKMGGNMSRRLMKAGHHAVPTWNLTGGPMHAHQRACL
jgi:3-hydroxyisobutyrate dehydrogenase-like beta-hydroxyacid dehydrogenase